MNQDQKNSILKEMISLEYKQPAMFRNHFKNTDKVYLSLKETLNL